MHLLLIHQNFPGQFRELAPAWLAAGHQVTAIGSSSERPEGPQWEQLRFLRYRFEHDQDPSLAQRGHAVAQVCGLLQDEGSQPDVVIAHSAWGEALELREAWPTTPLIVLPELWGNPQSLGFGFDDALTGQEIDPEVFSQQNGCAEHAVLNSDAALVATESQKRSFPEQLQQRLSVLPEGIDLEQIKPNPDTIFEYSGLNLRHGDPIVTLVSRELEPLRGLRQALKAWPLILAQEPSARLILVGETSNAGYGVEAPRGDSHLADALSGIEIPSQERLHWLGQIDHAEMLNLLRCSACHLALSYPYTLSWSVVEAMACGTPLVSNIDSPVSHLLRQEQNGLLVSFNDHVALAEAVVSLLRDQDKREAMGRAGRQTMASCWDLKRSLAAYETLFDRLRRQSSAESH